jgi:undecaprenyl-diphosphatase
VPAKLSRRGLYVAASAAGGFLLLTVLVARGTTAGLDEGVLRALRRPTDLALLRGPDWLEAAIRDVTALGSEAVLTVLVTVVVAYLLMLEHRRAALLVAVGTVGGVLVDVALKQIAVRSRQELVPRLVADASPSFPSGHAMLSAIVYLTLGTLLARLTERRRVRAFCLGTGCALTGIIGLSRIALGAHYPTDVLAGWLAGVSWAGLAWFVAQWLQWRGEVTREALK